MKKIIFLVFVLFSVMNLKSQSFKNEYGERFYVGGGFGIQIGTYSSFSASPHFGHYLFDKASVGVGLNYQLFRENIFGTVSFLNIYGARLFARYEPFEKIFAQAEYELMTYRTDEFSATREIETIIANGLLLGAGYRQFFGHSTSSNTYIMLLYNVNHTIYTPYSNPVFRVGLEFYF